MDFKEENSDFLSKMRRFTHNLNTPWINIFISKILSSKLSAKIKDTTEES